MMVATTAVPVAGEGTTPTTSPGSEKVQEPSPTSGEEESASGQEEPSAPAPAPVPTSAPPPRKTWALPKAPSKGSEVDAPKKKSFAEIMAEEKEKEEQSQIAKQKQLEQRLLQEEEAAIMRAMQASMAPATNNDGVDEDMDEDMKLALMLSMQDQTQADAAKTMPPAAASVASAAAPPAAAAAVATSADNGDDNGLTADEMKEIEKALQEADAVENAKTDAASLKLALELQNEEDGKIRAKQNSKKGPQGNVRTMNRADFLREKGEEDDQYYNNKSDDGYENDNNYDYIDEYDELEENEPGYRINSTKQSAWSRADGATIRGPNQELKTKHDPKLQGQTNAFRLDLRGKDNTPTGERAHVGNQAYNSFHRSMQKKTIKGVAAHGTGRANADTDKTREGALDGRVRLQIARAVNNGLIETFHGCVKEGKEALVFHADKGEKSEGFDVAVKVFKRISEFRNRGQYVEGDPRYGDGKDFKHAGARQQVELWAEKENRNLIRAYRAKVPVPKPLWHKENVLFLRFLGEEGWPCPQIREVDIKKGSKKWVALYEQTMEAMQLCYCDAKLVHGDLSEYNLMVCPERFLQRFDDEEVAAEEDEENAASEEKPAAKEAPATATALDGDEKKVSAVATAAENADTEKLPAVQTSGDSLQIVMIDFGQAVDLRHPDAEELLRRDVTRVKQFFDKKGITTVGIEEAMAYVQTKGAPLR